MIQPGHDPRQTSRLSSPTWTSALAVALLLVTIGGMTTWLALKYDRLRPRIGDMIVFVPNSSGTDTWRLTIATTAVTARNALAGPCVFDPNEMSAGGGSLIVEAREETSPPRFRVHWAGRHTAKGAGDCGPAADLTLERQELQRLANAAGGIGLPLTSFR
ncbi:MAG: hypothetical protein EXR07_14155 [Acetobacteraceae bacterium]|nr:hypothetical protein [Acetobacteraceae bacterium]